MNAPTNATLIFGKYEIQSRLAVGGMGEVFFAVQRGVQGFERPAILKNLLPDLAQQEGFIEQFLDEARVAATLNHPNVVSIYEVGLWDGVYFIAMEYIQGRNVSQLIRAAIRNKVPVPPLCAAQIIREAAAGLHHAHVAKDARGQPLNIVHRDISPQNIMVRDDGVTKVVDFGIARAANRATRTQTGAVKGKLAYMPPEQILAGADVTAQADQYALGVVLWEMCSGRRLFRAEHDVELMRMVVEAKVPPLLEVAPHVPPVLAEIVRRMMARDPAQRFPSCDHVVRALDQLLNQFAKPGEESPVAAFVRSLGPWDVPTPHATPSGPSKNFVISLGGQTATTPALPPQGARAEMATRASAGAAAPKPAPRRWAPAVAGLVVMALAAGATAWWRSGRAPPDEVAPPAPPPRVVVVPMPVNETPPPPKTVEPVAAPVEPTAAAAPARWALRTVPAGATVRLDGRPVGQTPLELTVSAGEPHFLLLERAGSKRDERELPALKEGELRQLEVTLAAARAAPSGATPRPSPPPVAVEASGPGFLTLSTTPWTKVSLGRDVLGSTPLFKVKLPPGEHALTLVNEGQNVSVTRRVTIRAGEVTKLDLKL